MVKSTWCDVVEYSKDRIDSYRYVHECIPKPWQPFFENLNGSGVSLLNHLADRLIEKGKLLNNAIEPQMPLLFKALELVDPKDVKVVILGQDPTPQKDKATGLAFHVEKPRSVPAVLHVFLEVAFEGFPVDLGDGNVIKWARQGVLLLNAALTCPHNPPNNVEDKAKYKSHSDIWGDFTISLIRHICNTAEPSVWLLWGKMAKSFSKQIKEKHLIIEGGHPSPMGTAEHGDSFFGRNYFNIANQFLEINGRVTIDWSLSSTRRNGLEFKLCYQTEKEVEQRQIKEQQLRNQQEYNQQVINLCKQQFTKTQQELEETNLELQNTKRDLKRELDRLWQLQNPKKINYLKNKQKNLEEEINEKLNFIYEKHQQINHLEYQQSHIAEKIQQNRKNQQYLKGLPKDLLKRNFQKQINAIDEELNKLR